MKIQNMLKPLKWQDKRPAEGERYRALALSPITRYVITDDGRGVKVIYHNFTEDEPAKTKPGFKSVAEAKDWVQGEHYPKKMAPWLNVDQWVSVDDELPTKHGEYLVHVKEGYQSIDEYFMGASCDTWCYYNGHDGSNVTHWQPLPPPPMEVPDDL